MFGDLGLRALRRRNCRVHGFRVEEIPTIQQPSE